MEATNTTTAKPAPKPGHAESRERRAKFEALAHEWVRLGYEGREDVLYATARLLGLDAAPVNSAHDNTLAWLGSKWDRLTTGDMDHLLGLARLWAMHWALTSADEALLMDEYAKARGHLAVLSSLGLTDYAALVLSRLN
ncbi:MAG: hypothetical protein KDA05_10540 [Phycisphaerales bacterium]|nr:hypothetical protein [Phycisphaerales bacterium]